MFIAFEGPDKTGKSTSAASLSHDGTSIYNITKRRHEIMGLFEAEVPDLVVAYDRIDWLTHMVYRLAMPDRDWNDDRPRTVFAMPDTHLVFKLHEPKLVKGISDELYSTGGLAPVNDMYFYHADFLAKLNEERDYALFKTVSLMLVSNDVKAGTFDQQLVAFSSPVTDWAPVYSKTIRTDEDLLKLLRYEDQHRL